MRRALWRQPVDRLPVQVNLTGAMAARVAARWGCGVDDLGARFGNHLLRLEPGYPTRLSSDGKVRFDGWGAGWGAETEGYWHAHAPLAGKADLGTYPWPDPDAPGLLAAAERLLAADGDGHFIVPNFGFALFERAWSLRGFEALLMELVAEPVWVEELLERVVTLQVRLAKRFVGLRVCTPGSAGSSAAGAGGARHPSDAGEDVGRRGLEAASVRGIDGGYFGDDYGAQRSLLFAPRIWRQMIKPRLARLFAVFREAGLPVILHSDGDLWPILPDLVDIGLTCLNPVQPEVLDHGRLRREFGRHLSFYGGLSTQAVLSGGTPAQVREAVGACVCALAPDGTGLVLGPSHRMQSDIPVENVEAMLEAFP